MFHDRFGFRMRGLILAAYLLAAILPVLSLAERPQPTQAEHATAMAMAGHLAHMATTESSNDNAQRLLCQQHCLLAAATLPSANRDAEHVARASRVAAGGHLLASTLTIPPPGPPPKVAVI
jgi:NAD/NADP transhydrogenase beta subunit